MIKDASISECGKYRWELSRTWRYFDTDNPGTGVLWIMLNPSTADAAIDDPTIRRCIGFSKAWGYESMMVVNLFALRATDPAALRGTNDPIGEENDEAIRLAAKYEAAVVVAAWGVHGAYLGRDREVMRILADAGCTPKCLGVTKDGHPKHPVRLRKDTLLVPFQLPAESEADDA